MSRRILGSANQNHTFFWVMQKYADMLLLHCNHNNKPQYLHNIYWYFNATMKKCAIVKILKYAKHRWFIIIHSVAFAKCKYQHWNSFEGSFSVTSSPLIFKRRHITQYLSQCTQTVQKRTKMYKEKDNYDNEQNWKVIINQKLSFHLPFIPLIVTHTVFGNPSVWDGNPPLTIHVTSGLLLVPT